MDHASPKRPQSHDHHTVSKFWLKQFADGNGFMKMFDVMEVDLIARRIHSRRATVEKDLYILDSWNETHDIDEHDLFRPIEDKAAKVMASLRKAQNLSDVWPLDDRARNDMARFLAASVIRTPRYRAQVQVFMERKLEETNRPLMGVDLYRSGVITGNPEDLVRLGKRYGLWHKDDKAPANFQSEYLREELPNLSRHLFEQRWMIMRTPSPSFVISDNPVALIGDLMNAGLPTFYNVDFRESRASMTTLSRDLVLVTDWHPKSVLNRAHLNGDMAIPFDDKRAEFARALSIANAEKHFFEHPEDTMFEDIRDGRSPSDQAGF